jgi:hypothetical protein
VKKSTHVKSNLMEKIRLNTFLCFRTLAYRSCEMSVLSVDIFFFGAFFYQENYTNISSKILIKW